MRRSFAWLAVALVIGLVAMLLWPKETPHETTAPASANAWTAPKAPSQQPAPNEAASISVLDAASGQPIAGARLESVATRWLGHALALSDRDGQLRLPPNPYGEVWISKTGYLPLRIDMRRLPSTVRLHAGGHHVRGSVVDLLGGVVEGAAVCAGAGLCVLTSSSGTYDLTVPSGSWMLRVVDESYFPRKHPVHVRGDITVDFQVAPGSTIEGLVVDEQGEPVVGARIEHRGFEVRAGGGYGIRKPVSSRQVLSDERGVFRIGPLAPATYFVHASLPEAGATPDPVTVAVPLLEHIEGVELVVQRGHAIAGTVRDIAGTPVDGARVSISSNNRQRIEVTTDEKGGFRAVGLSSRAWAVRVSEGGVPASSAGSTRIEVVDADVRDVDLVVERGVTIQGSVSPAMAVSISLIAEDRAMSARALAARRIAASLHVQTGQDGGFELSGVPAGRWRVVARGPQHVGEQAIVVEQDPIASIDIPLFAGATVEGTLRDADGHAVVADILLVGKDEHRARSDARGAFTLSSLPEDDFAVRVEAQGTPLTLPAKTRVTTRSGSTDTLSLEITTRPAVLRGVVVDAQGEPAPEIVLHAYAARGDEPTLAISDVEGAFEIDAFEGLSYRIDAQGPPSLGSASITTDDVQQPIELTLEPAIVFEGRVLLDGAPVPSFRARLPTAGALDLFFSSSDGRFSLDMSRGGIMTLLADEGVAQAEITLSQGETISHTFDLQPWGGIEGVVEHEDGTPVEGASIKLSSEAGRRRSLDIMRGGYETKSDEHGVFEIEGVGPGAAQIIAKVGDRSIRSERVTVAPGETLQLAPLIVAE